jgi:adenosine deaminase
MPSSHPAVLEFALSAPKAELHLHLEGTLEPELAFRLATRNGIKLPYNSVEELKHAYNFSDLQSFLDLYYGCAAVLVSEDDFAELAWEYLSRVSHFGVVHAELSFDPQAHLPRGISFGTIIAGLEKGCARGLKELGISTRLVMCFLRHLPESDALKTLEEAMPFIDRITGVGLDSGERGNPPHLFKEVYAKCRGLNKHLTCHEGEEGPAGNITEALDVLKVGRIDHGVRAVDDPEVVARLAREKIPLTCCPLSNVRLCVFKELKDHTLPKLIEAGCKVTINSDDPAYLGGYLDDSIRACHETFQWDVGTWYGLLRNSLEASWVEEGEKERWIRDLDAQRVKADRATSV